MCQTVQSVAYAFFGLFFLLPVLSFGRVTFGKFNPAHNRMGKGRGLKLAFFKVPHIKKVL